MYETREAASLWVAIQTDDADKVDPVARAVAAQALLSAVEAQAKKHGFTSSWEKSKDGGRDILNIQRPHVRACNAWLTVAEDGKVIVGGDTAQRRQPDYPKVVFNVASKVYVGTEPDTFYVPVPGEPKVRKRNALAAVTEALIPYLKHLPAP